MNEGYLAGEYPGGITTLGGVPVEADIRIAWRSPAQGEGDGLIVARTRSNSSGEWRVTGLSIDELYDVIGSLPGYQDQIVAGVTPAPVNFAYIEDALRPNSTFNGMLGEMTVVGGIPPYTFMLIDDEPDGITFNFDRRLVTADGVTDLPDGAYYFRAEVTSSNGVQLEFEIPVYVGFNPPEGFELERTALHRPTHFRHGGSNIWRPTWLAVKVNELEEDDGVFVKLTWMDVNGFSEGYRVYRQETPFEGDALPTPMAVLPAASGKPPQEVTWTDTTAVEGQTYYYRVSTFYGDEEKITDERTVVASPAPTDIGEFFQGGYYIGNIAVDSDTYAILMAPEEADTTRTWKTGDTATAGTDSATDGWANTEAMVSTESLRLAHPAAAYCRAYNGAGFDDWYLPARNELTLAWTYRDQLAELNLAMNETRVWSSTQNSASYAWSRIFTSGAESGSIGKGISCRVRPVRRLKLPI